MKSELLSICAALFVSVCAAQCRMPSSPPERRAVSSSIVLKALLSSVYSEGGNTDTAEIWIQEVYKGKSEQVLFILLWKRLLIS